MVQPQRHSFQNLAATKCHSVACIYYSASDPPIQGPYLILNGDGAGPINNMCVLTQVAPSYAPPNQQLISIVVLKAARSTKTVIEQEVRAQLIEWFGGQVHHWRHLQTEMIREAQPTQLPPTLNPYSTRTKLENGLYICGDYRSTATIDGALLSGRRAAEDVVKEIVS